MGSRSETGRGTFEGTREPDHYNVGVPTAGECACPVHSPPRGVTRQRCGLLPNHFGHVFCNDIYCVVRLTCAIYVSSVLFLRTIALTRPVKKSGGYGARSKKCGRERQRTVADNHEKVGLLFYLL